MHDHTETSPVLEFPCRFPIKMMGRQESGFHETALGIIERHAGSIDAAGLFTAVKPGQVNVIAKTETTQQQVSVTIAQEPVAALQVAMTPETVVAADKAQLVATVNDQGSTAQGEVSQAMAQAGIPRVASNVTSDDWGDPNAYPMDASGTGLAFMLPQALQGS